MISCFDNTISYPDLKVKMRLISSKCHSIIKLIHDPPLVREINHVHLIKRPILINPLHA